MASDIIIRLDDESLQAIKELTEALKDIKELEEKPPLFWPIEKEKNPLSPPYIITCGEGTNYGTTYRYGKPVVIKTGTEIES